MTSGLLQRACACGQHSGNGVECESCKKKHPGLQRAAVTPAAPDVAPSIVHEVLRSPGCPLDEGTRAFMESRFGQDFSRLRVHSTFPRRMQDRLAINQPGDVYEQEADQVAGQIMRTPQGFAPSMVDRALYPRHLNEQADPFKEPGMGYDFSNVRVHTGAKAAESARAVSALAYTVGRDVVFGNGQYNPSTRIGQELLAHELMHVVQQGSIRAPRFAGDASALPEVAPVLQRRLAFTVGPDTNEQTIDRFESLVNRLLPSGWRFSITPRPSVRMAESIDPLNLHERELPSISVWGSGSLEQPDQFDTQEEHSSGWQRNFRDALWVLIRATAEESRFELVDQADPQTAIIFGDAYARGAIDVADYERMPPQFAAALLIHALEESLSRPETPALDPNWRDEFNARHDAAIIGLERYVMRGTRLPELTRPAGIPIPPPADLEFEYWFPYQMPDNSIRAVVLSMRGHTVLRGRMAGFPSFEEFQRAAWREESEDQQPSAPAITE